VQRHGRSGKSAGAEIAAGAASGGAGADEVHGEHAEDHVTVLVQELDVRADQAAVGLAA
jgi:hypothetical protein